MHWSWQGSTLQDIPFTPRAKQVLEFSSELASQMGQNHINTEHLLLGILCEGNGLAVRVLENLRVDLHHLEQQLHGVEEG